MNKELSIFKIECLEGSDLDLVVYKGLQSSSPAQIDLLAQLKSSLKLTFEHFRTGFPAENDLATGSLTG